tara:strand:+ start:10 stop:582 length:573 start_codon:yes stop_codon:yes gene_type:complete
MSKNKLQKIWGLPIELPYREKVEELQEFITKYGGDSVEICGENDYALYPSLTKYNHYFSDGLYVREMFCPKDHMVFSLIHKTANPLFLMKGKITFSSEEGVQELVAPTFVLTKPGTKRIIFILEDSVVVNVHPNPDGLTDLKEIEKKMFARSWEEYDENLEQNVWQLFEHKDYYKKIENEENEENIFRII